MPFQPPHRQGKKPLLVANGGTGTNSPSKALTNFGVSAFAQTVLDDTTAAAALTTLGVSSFAQTLLDDAAASNARTTLGLGTVATQSYETGSWTPTYTTSGTDFDSVTYDGNVAGLYTKIGDTVFVQAFIGTDSITVGAATGDVRVGGLPFTSNTSSGSADFVGLTIGSVSAFGGDMPFAVEIRPNGTVADISYRTTSNGASTKLVVADMGTGANANFMTFSGCYKV